MNPIEKYIHDRDEQVRQNWLNGDLYEATENFTEQIVKTNYVKSFTWAGIPIIQYATDLVAMQEIIFKVVPDVIIETGVAFGGMTLFYADMLDILRNSDAIVIGVDKEIRPENRPHLKANARVHLVEGDSVGEYAINMVKRGISPDDTVLVSLDSNHSHAHVLKELELYAPLVSVGSYIVAFDAAIEFWGHLDKNQDRPWGKGNNPHTAVMEFLKTGMGQNFVIDKEVEMRALITSAIDGWLRRIK